MGVVVEEYKACARAYADRSRYFTALVRVGEAFEYDREWLYKGARMLLSRLWDIHGEEACAMASAEVDNAGIPSGHADVFLKAYKTLRKERNEITHKAQGGAGVDA